VSNTPPTVVSPATVTASTKSAALGVLGADDAGESTLIYTWSAVGTPPAPVTFSVNGSNAAKNSVATFTRAGTYNLQCNIRDTSGLTVTSSVSVAIKQVLNRLSVSPNSTTISTGGTQQFSCAGTDQFGNPMSPSVSWSATAGTIGSNGMLTAPASSGSGMVTATSGTVSATTPVTFTAAPLPIKPPTNTGTTPPGISATVLQPPSSINWSGPIVITSGGTYTGNWRSLNAGTPAVDIETSQPVIILNSNIESMSTLISASNGNANVTVKNTSGWALNPNVSGQSPGRFLDAENFSNLDIEDNSMVGTAGIEMGYWTGGGTVKILCNNALNIDGRWSDGNGGFQTGANANDLVQFAQFNHCIGMSGVEIAWNCVINLPGQSRVEDNISVFQTSGTAASPILIHDNYVQGAYPVDPANDSSFSGGGIMLSDGWNGSAATDTGNVQAHNNFVIDTGNYGMAIASGRNDVIYNNTVISAGVLPSGQKEASQNVGIYIWNQGDPNFANGQEYGNTIGWMGPGGGQNDTWTPNGSGQTGDTTLPGTITLAQQQSYYGVWAQQVSAAGMTIGAS
jgi:hypothetical protein